MLVQQAKDLKNELDKKNKKAQELKQEIEYLEASKVKMAQSANKMMCEMRKCLVGYNRSVTQK